MKKITSLRTEYKICILCLMMLPVYITAQTAVEESAPVRTPPLPAGTIQFEDYTYIVRNDGTAAITGYGGYTDAVIPAQVDGKAVTAIKKDSFLRCSEITSIAVPASVTEIEPGALAIDGGDNYRTFQVTVDDANPVYAVMDGALYVKQTKVLHTVFNRLLPAAGGFVIPEGITAVGADAFKGCSYLVSVVIPETVTSIGQGAFSGCTQLKAVTVPSSVTVINPDTFNGCTRLTSIALPPTLTSIGDRAFYNTGWGYDGPEVAVPALVSSIGSRAFYHESEPGQNRFRLSIVPGNTVFDMENGALCDKNTHTLRMVFAGAIKNGTFSIPSGITSIGNEAFYGCGNLETLVIPDTVTSLGDGVCEGCLELTSVVIPKSVTSVGKNAFSGCIKLLSVSLPDTVTVIDDGAFSDCTALEHIRLPSGLTELSARVFSGCRSLTSVTLPASLISVGEESFALCSGLTVLLVPDSVTSIAESAFEKRNGRLTFRVNENSFAWTWAKQHSITVSFIPSWLKTGN